MSQLAHTFSKVEGLVKETKSRCTKWAISKSRGTSLEHSWVERLKRKKNREICFYF